MQNMNEEINQAVDKAFSDAATQNWIMHGGLTSVIVIIAFFVMRYALVRIVRGKKEILDQDGRRWINRINNSTSVAILITLVFIWAPQLQTFALSLTAVAVAVVLTTKELLMCLTGGLLRTSTKPFDIGDWIRVDDVTGEVMRITAMTTLIEEIDTIEHSYQYTGRTTQIPNSKFLTINVENLNFLKKYIYQDVRVTLAEPNLDPSDLMTQLKEITQNHFEPHREAAVNFNKHVEQKSALDFADADPQFFLKTTNVGHYTYTARFLSPTKQAALIAADITRDFLSYIHKQKAKKSSQKDSS